MSDLDIKLILRLVNQIKGPAAEARRDLGQIDDAVGQTRSRAGAALKSVGRAAVVGAVAAGTAAAAATVQSVRSAASMQDAWSDANKTLGLAPVQLAQMQDEASRLAIELGVTRRGMVDIIATAGQLGIRGKEDILAFARDAGMMSETFDVSQGAAAEMMGSWREQLGYTQDEVRRTADRINYLGNTTAAESSKIAEFYTRVASIADGAGLAEEATLALGAAMIASGRAPEVAATSMIAMTRVLGRGYKDLSERQQGLVDSLGLDWDTIQESMVTDAPGAIEEVVQAISDMPEWKRNAAAQMLFGDEAFRGLGDILTDVERFQEVMGRQGGILGSDGSMLQEYLALSDDVVDNWRRVREGLSWQSSGLGQALLPPINDGLRDLSNVLLTLDDRVTVFERIGAAARGFREGVGAGDGPGVLAEQLGRLKTAISEFIVTDEMEDPGEFLAKIFRDAEEAGQRVAAARDALVGGIGGIMEALDGFDPTSAEDRAAAIEALRDRLAAIEFEIPTLDLGELLPAEMPGRERLLAFEAELKADLGRLKAAIEEFDPTSRVEWAGAVERLFNEVGTMKVPTLDLTKLLPEDMPGLEQLQGLETAINETIGLIGQLREAVAKGAGRVSGALIEGDYDEIVDAVRGALDEIQGIEIKKLDLSGLIPEDIPGLEVLRSAVGLLEGVVNAVGSLANYAKTGVTNVLEGVLTGFGDSGGEALESLKGAAESVGPILDNLAGIAKGIGGLYDSLAGSEAFASGAQMIGETIGAIVGYVTEGAARNIEMFADAIEFITEALEKLVNFNFDDWGLPEFDFSWGDVLPEWDWGAIVPDLGEWFSGQGDVKPPTPPDRSDIPAL